MLTLHAAAASAAFQLATMPEYPSRHLAPNDVIEAFTSNLQASKHSHAFRWVSEHCRQATGVRRRQSIRSQSVPYYLQFPDYKTLPQYRPLVGCAQYELVHGIQHGRIFFGRVHCWPTQVRYIGDMTIAVAASSPIEYQYVLKQNPDVYPACYEYDPMQPASPPVRRTMAAGSSSPCDARRRRRRRRRPRQRRPERRRRRARADSDQPAARAAPPR